MKDKTKGLSLQKIQTYNRRVILSALQNQVSCSRKDLSQLTDLDQATVTRAVSTLIDNNIIEETGFNRGERGRRSISLSFSSSGHYILCVRLQRRSFAVSTYNLKGDILKIVEHAIPIKSSAKEIFKKITKTLDEQIAQHKNIDGICIAVPGPFLEKEERVILMTGGSQWEGFDLIPAIRAHYNQLPVYSIHDAKAASLAEWRYHAIKEDSKVMMYISAGQGVGSAVIVDGTIHRGALGVAGELGHTSIDINGELCKCGNRGCIELYSSRISLILRIKEQADGFSQTTLTSKSSFNQVVKAFHNGDQLAVQEVHRVSRYLAQGIVNCINFINPDLIIIGDEYSSLGHAFLDEIKNNIQPSVLPSIFNNVQIELSHQSEDTVLRGSYLEVLNQTYLNEPRANLVDLGTQSVN